MQTGDEEEEEEMNLISSRTHRHTHAYTYTSLLISVTHKTPDMDVLLPIKKNNKVYKALLCVISLWESQNTKSKTMAE